MCTNSQCQFNRKASQRHRSNVQVTVLGIVLFAIVIFYTTYVLLQPPSVDKAAQPTFGQFKRPNAVSPQNVFHQNEIGDDSGGLSTGPGYVIQWSDAKDRTLNTSSQAHSATALQVLDATLARMQFVQSTLQASDKNARALWHVLQARDMLSGTPVPQKTTLSQPSRPTVLLPPHSVGKEQ